jgi:hypothetical protein
MTHFARAMRPPCPCPHASSGKTRRPRAHELPRDFPRTWRIIEVVQTRYPHRAPQARVHLRGPRDEKRVYEGRAHSPRMQVLFAEARRQGCPISRAQRARVVRDPSREGGERPIIPLHHWLFAVSEGAARAGASHEDLRRALAMPHIRRMLQHSWANGEPVWMGVDSLKFLARQSRVEERAERVVPVGHALARVRALGFTRR